jgi:hypothetical protein
MVGPNSMSARTTARRASSHRRRFVGSTVVEAWFEKASLTATGSAFASIHVDDLVGETFVSEPLATSLTAFDELARCADATRRGQIAVLVISLPPTNHLVRTPPPAIRPAWLRCSPPGLSLAGPQLWSTWGDDEEYPIPVSPAWFTSPTAESTSSNARPACPAQRLAPSTAPSTSTQPPGQPDQA